MYECTREQHKKEGDLTVNVYMCRSCIGRYVRHTIRISCPTHIRVKIYRQLIHQKTKVEYKKNIIAKMRTNYHSFFTAQVTLLPLQTTGKFAHLSFIQVICTMSYFSCIIQLLI